MSKNIDQVFVANPITSNAGTDLMYFGQSPYGAGNDAAMLYSNFKAQFTLNVLTTKGDILAYDTAPDRLAVGSTNGQILQVNSGAAIGLSWSTATYPTSTTINQILYSSSANVISGLATANNGILFTSGGGVPSIGTAPIIAGGTGVTSVTTAPASTAWAGWDTNKNLSANNFISGYTTTATAAATTVLAVGSAYQQYFTGTTTQTVTMPVTSTLVLGQQYFINNLSTGIVTVQSSGGNTIQAMASNTTLTLTCILTSGTTAASWNAEYVLDTSLTLPLSLANGGTNASLTANNGGIVWSNASQLQILSGTSTANQLLLSGSSTTPAWSTTTYPATNAINTLLYASSVNVISALATANSATLITSAGGVPSISQTLPTAVQSNITQLGTQTQALNMGSNKINAVNDPTSAQDAATKNYVDNAIAGVNPAVSVIAATTSALTVVYSNGASGIGATLTNAGAQAAFSIDGQSPTVTQRVLIKNQASTFQNGVYTVTVVGSGITNWVLTRALDYDQPSDINSTGAIPVLNGTVNASSSWIINSSVTTVGTDPITYTQFTFPASTFLQVANNLSDVNNANTSFNNISPLTTKGDLLGFSTVNARLAVGSTNGQILQVNSGGTVGFSWSTPTYPSASGSTGLILRSNGTNNIYSTSTFADTYTASNILYSNGTNTVTGLATANGGVLVTSNTGVPSILAGSGTTNTVLQATASGTPAWSTATYPATTTINQILYSSSANVVGGISAAANGVLVSNNSNVPSMLAGSGTTGTILQANASAAPSWSTATYPSSTTINQILFSSSANVIGGIATANSSILQTNGSGVPSFSTSLPSGTVFISTVDQTTSSVTLAVNVQYITDNGASLVTYTLPTTCAIGTIFKIRGFSSGGWKVAQSSGQQIHVGSAASTSGATGSIASSNQYDCVDITCVAANNTFVANAVQGNLTIV